MGEREEREEREERGEERVKREEEREEREERVKNKEGRRWRRWSRGRKNCYASWQWSQKPPLSFSPPLKTQFNYNTQYGASPSELVHLGHNHRQSGQLLCVLRQTMPTAHAGSS